MSHCWPQSITFRNIPLVSPRKNCPTCNRRMRISKHRRRRLYTRDGPICLILKRYRCPHDDCSQSGTLGPEQEIDYALPRWLIGWDVFCWIGHRRFARHWGIPQIRQELEDTYRMYVVRELTRRRVLFAEPLLSSTMDEVRRLMARAKKMVEALEKRVVLWMSDKQDAFVTCIAEEFPEVPHRYCQNHFIRDVAKPVLVLRRW